MVVVEGETKREAKRGSDLGRKESSSKNRTRSSIWVSEC